MVKKIKGPSTIEYNIRKILSFDPFIASSSFSFRLSVSFLLRFSLNHRFFLWSLPSSSCSDAGTAITLSRMRSYASSLSQSQSADSSDAGSAAERRLREAEERLRDAIEELQRRQRRERGLHPPCDHADESCVANAIGNLCQSFLLSYGVRVGIGILLRAFKLARRQSYSSLLDLKVPNLFIYLTVSVYFSSSVLFNCFIE